MPFQFTKHYTLDEARALLPQIRQWLEQLEHFRTRVEKFTKRTHALLEKGHDVGGESVNQWVRALAELKGVLQEFEAREIFIKDIERGLIDFPALRDGKEVFLCWEKGEEDIEHWHDLDTGYSGREPL